jgi:hypothetical protein
MPLPDDISNYHMASPQHFLSIYGKHRTALSKDYNVSKVAIDSDKVAIGVSRVVIACGRTDLHCGIGGLTAIVQE